MDREKRGQAMWHSEAPEAYVITNTARTNTCTESLRLYWRRCLYEGSLPLFQVLCLGESKFTHRPSVVNKWTFIIADSVDPQITSHERQDDWYSSSSLPPSATPLIQFQITTKLCHPYQGTHQRSDAIDPQTPQTPMHFSQPNERRGGDLHPCNILSKLEERERDQRGRRTQ